jgi:hypothetical protein
MPKGRLSIAIGVALVLFTSCNPVYTDIDYDPNAEFLSYHTFSWLEVPSADPKNATQAREQSPLMAKRIRQGIHNELDKKGVQYIEEGGSLLVIYYLGSQQMTEITKTMYSAGDRVGGGGATVRDIDKGTLIVDLIDSSTMELVWRGTAENSQRTDVSQDKINETTDKAIKQLFKKYPPK